MPMKMRFSIPECFIIQHYWLKTSKDSFRNHTQFIKEPQFEASFELMKLWNM